MTLEQLFQSFWINIAAGVALLILNAWLKWLHGRISSGNPLYRRLALPVVGLMWLVLNLLYLQFARVGTVFFVFVSSVAAGWIVYREIAQFWRIGLVGADVHIRTGIDFTKSLKMCSSSLDFLGIGAAKLTAERTVFEETIKRCDRGDRPIRFLLCRPDSEGLERIAKSAGEDRTAYQKRVQESLRVIAQLKSGRAKNIEVRFYREFPTFRLMFIDDAICLASHYVLGKGLGSEVPQLHVIKPRGSRDIDSLYYAFRSYFERIWQDSESWDFKSHL